MFEILGHLPYCTYALVFGHHTYGKCPKNSNTKVSDKMTYANSADPDQTAPDVYIVCHSTKYFKKPVHKKHNLGQNSRE